jgi:hypothetical protein
MSGDHVRNAGPMRSSPRAVLGRDLENHARHQPLSASGAVACTAGRSGLGRPCDMDGR